MSEPLITASEIESFVYCKRGWQLKKAEKLGVTSEMIAGDQAHSHLANLLWWHKLLLSGGLITIGIGILGVLLYLLFQYFF